MSEQSYTHGNIVDTPPEYTKGKSKWENCMSEQKFMIGDTVKFEGVVMDTEYFNGSLIRVFVVQEGESLTFTPDKLTLVSRPKKRVKKYKWVLKYMSGKIGLTVSYYANEHEVISLEGVTPIQRIDSEFIETEE